MMLDEYHVETLKFIFEKMDSEKGGALSDWEKSFMQDQKERYEKYGADTFFSYKQWKIIMKIEKILSENR